MNDEVIEFITLDERSLLTDFKQWAFGSTSPMSGLDCVGAWNSLHGDKLRLRCEGDPLNDMKKMIKLYEKSKTDSIKY